MTPDHAYDARVLRVLDADTLDVEVDLGFRMLARLPLRLAHVDAPERYTEEGKAATAWVAGQLGELPASVVVRTFKPVDKYGRYLADVFLGDLDLAAELVSRGLARPYEGGTR